jgi:hypothetical protein
VIHEGTVGKLANTYLTFIINKQLFVEISTRPVTTKYQSHQELYLRCENIKAILIRIASTNYNLCVVLNANFMLWVQNLGSKGFSDLEIGGNTGATRVL